MNPLIDTSPDKVLDKAKEEEERQEIRRIKNAVEDFCASNWPHYFSEVA